MVMNNKLII